MFALYTLLVFSGGQGSKVELFWGGFEWIIAEDDVWKSKPVICFFEENPTLTKFLLKFFNAPILFIQIIIYSCHYDIL